MALDLGTFSKSFKYIYFLLAWTLTLEIAALIKKAAHKKQEKTRRDEMRWLGRHEYWKQKVEKILHTAHEKQHSP